MTYACITRTKYSDIRWVSEAEPGDEDQDKGYFERACESCRRKSQGGYYWPMTLEYWDRRNLKMCKTCFLEAKRREARARRRRDPDFRGRSEARLLARDAERHRLARAADHLRSRPVDVRMHEVQES